MPKWSGFIGPSNPSQSPVVDAERLINWHLTKIDGPNARNPVALYPTPGVQNAFMLGHAPIRGLLGQSVNSVPRAWVVGDTTLAEFDANFNITVRNPVTPLLRDGNPAYLVTNALNQMLISSGGHKYTLDLQSATFTDQGSGVIGPVLQVEMLDSFGIALEAQGFLVSKAGDFTSWDNSNFVQRSTAPDQWRAMKVIKNRIYFVGEYTTDIYWDVGSFPVPFAPIQGAIIREGTAAANSLAEFKGTLVWLAQNRYGTRTVQQASGYSSKKISTEALDYQLGTYATVSDAEGFTYQEAGDEHYILNLPTANKSWGYTENGGWYEIGTWNIARGDYDVWHPRCHCLAFDKHFFGDRSSDSVFQGSIAFGLDALGAPLRRMRVAPVLGPDHARVPVNVLEVVFENGLGLAVGQGSDPTVMLQKSKTAGRTWGTERWRHAGRGGDFKPRVRWMQLGSGRDLAVKLVVTDPIPWRVADALINPSDEPV